MAEAARARGYAYLAVTDHSASHGFGNDVQPERLRERIEEVRELNSGRRGFRVLAGSEVNILPDGSLDYDDELLAELDWVVASVHTSFNISERAMTERVVTAIEHPLVDCIGHVSGRLIGRREPYRVDVERIAEAAARTGTMLEINGNPNRRDLSERHARLAAEAGADLSPSQTAALSTIDRHGPLTPSELATLERVQRPTATRIVARLEGAGLVQRAADPADGRSFIVSATAQGRSLLRKLRTRKNVYLARRLRELSDDEVAVLAGAAEILERL